jgi:hypothetical protein
MLFDNFSAVQSFQYQLPASAIRAAIFVITDD